MPLVKQELLDIFRGENLESDTEVDVARQIADWYDRGIRNGRDLTIGNTVATVNLPGLYNSLSTAFFENGNPTHLQVVAQAFNAGVIAYWTGGILQSTVVPPGGITVVNNIVTNPGTPAVTFSIPDDNDSYDPFLDQLIQGLEAHLRTVQGITTALVPSPGGPVATPFPWVGYN